MHCHVAFDGMYSVLAVIGEWTQEAGLGKDMSEVCHC
jgi:hypothetical protein